MLTLLTSLYFNKEGVTVIEYAFIAMLIAMVIVASLKLIGDNISIPYQQAADNLQSPTPQ